MSMLILGGGASQLGADAGLDPGDIGMAAHTLFASVVLIKGIGTASALLNLLTNGDATASLAGDSTSTTPAINTTNEWLENSASSTNADWEVRATITSGSFTSGTFGSWLAMTSNRTWGNARVNTAGSDNGTMTLDFGEIGTSTSLVTVTNIQCNVTVTS